ncbi:ImmA/IrrE family metallo-endopeptidase [Mycobacterium hodleri]|uniref:ImmA/IrrE family metallo-endopeptidase n=1 Tax=Mycolicibacterium hodleri TaxID=49897 RepID=A0A544VWE1_9MYCO|nr:ImmA/IrrE family metallo-endopeptidase [Mycolicibacterium hodleri]TQR84290.1 ImmA/IrrE family metallo-endopeptidase [Mycolicibacterium hodleri]
MADSRSDSPLSYVANRFEADWAVAPGSLIQAELDALEYSQADVAARTNISTKHFNQLINGHVPLSPDIAVALERVLDIPAEMLLQMDATWQADKVRRTSASTLAGMQHWVAKFPQRALQEYRVVDFSAAASARVEALLRFFRVADEKSFDRIFLAPQVNYRRSQKFSVDPYATALWRRLAEVQADTLLDGTADYDAGALRAAAQRLPSLSRLPVGEGFRAARDMLSGAGVLLVFVPEIDETRISGATWWHTPSHPIIALTGRYRFVDAFWFTLVHEVAHVLLHPKRATFLHFERARHVDDNTDQQETAADAFASETFFTDRQRCELVLLSTKAEVEAFARKANLSKGIVAGQFGHYTGNWSRFGKLRESIDLAAAILGPSPATNS